MDELLALFDEALNHRPFLMFELGYTRITDWMVHIYDKAGGIERKLIVTQSYERDEAIAEASAQLRELLAEWSS